MSRDKLFTADHQRVENWARAIADGDLNLSAQRRALIPVVDPLVDIEGWDEASYSEVYRPILETFGDVGSEEIRCGKGWFYELDVRYGIKFGDNEGSFRIPRYAAIPTQQGPETTRTDAGHFFTTLDKERSYIYLEDDDQEILAGVLEQDLTNKYFSDGRPWFDIRSFGAAVNGTTDDKAAWLAAIAAVPANGGIIFNPGHSVTSVQLALPNRTWIVGLNSFTSRIIAHATFPVDTALIRQGIGEGTVFNVRVYRCGLDCNNIAGSTGIYSNEIQEHSGCFLVDINKYRAWGINYENAEGTAASLVGVQHVLCFGSTSGHTGGIRFSSVAGQGYIKNASIVPSGAAMGGDAILVNGGNVNCANIHMERHTDGIHYADGSAGSIKHVYGHQAAGSIVQLIHLGDNCNVTLEDINAAGSDGDILVDDAREITVSVAETGYIQFYANNEIKLGPLSLGPGTQNAIVDVDFPALAGANDEVVLKAVATQLQNKELFNCHLAGQTNGYFVSVSGVGKFETVRAYPLGTVVGTSDQQTLQRKTFAEHGSWNPDLVLRLLDAGGDHYYNFVVSDLAASRNVVWPVLDQSPSTLIFAEQAGQVFDHGLVINEDGNDSDTRIEGNTLPFLVNVDAGADAVGFDAATTDLTHRVVVKNDVDGKCLRIIGHGAVWGFLGKINFGDGDFVYLEEFADDHLEIYAAQSINLVGAGDGVGINDQDPEYTLDVNGSFRAVGAARFDNDLTFVGAGSGLVFGSMYNHNTPTVVTINDVDVAVRIPEGFTVGQAHGSVFENNREHRVLVAGKYEIHWSISFTADAANQDIEGCVMIDNALDEEGTAHRKIGTGTDTGCIAGTCTLALSADGEIALGVVNRTADNDVTVQHANMSFSQVGG